MTTGTHGNTTSTADFDAQVELIDRSVEARLGADWTEYPGGWPGQIEAALIDAVLSIRARYGTPTSGVRAAVGRWRQQRGVQRIDDLTALVSIAPDELAVVLNKQVLRGGLTKAEAIVQAAGRLTAVGVQHGQDLRPDDPDHRSAYVGVKGLGKVTWHYFTMLLGTPSVKADTWILRFVASSGVDDVNPETARRLIETVAAQRNKNATHLDHAIWAHMRRAR